jgi:hypothetical protein
MAGEGLITVAGAAGFEGGRVPADAELVEKVESLPWRSLWVRSSHVDRIAWCESSKVPFEQRPGSVFPAVDPGLPLGWLWVHFRGDRVYVYSDVPRPLYSAVVQAQSPGGALGELIKGRYRYAGVDLQTGRSYTE